MEVKISEGLELDQPKPTEDQEQKNLMDKYIKEQQEELNKRQEELVVLLQLQAKYPDISYSTDRWGKKRFHSAMVNNLADHFYTHHSCGCCDDAPLLVRAYAEFGDTKVYARPDSVCIGEKHWNGGEYFDYDWEEKLRKANYSQAVIDGVRKEYEENERIRRYDDEDDDDDYVEPMV